MLVVHVVWPNTCAPPAGRNVNNDAASISRWCKVVAGKIITALGWRERDGRGVFSHGHKPTTAWETCVWAVPICPSDKFHPAGLKYSLSTWVTLQFSFSEIFNFFVTFFAKNNCPNKSYIFILENRRLIRRSLLFRRFERRRSASSYRVFFFHEQDSVSYEIYNIFMSLNEDKIHMKIIWLQIYSLYSIWIHPVPK